MLDGGIITFRCRDGWAFTLIANILVRNIRPGKRTLYLHWVDYHRRYWSLDYDLVLRLAKECGADTDDVSDSIHFMRAFSRDTNAVQENWERIFAFRDMGMAVLDSPAELYEDDGAGTMTHAIGRFVQLCNRNDCPGIVLDRSRRGIHNYLAHVSSVILEIEARGDFIVDLIKHPCMADLRLDVPRDGQHKLRRWLC